MRLRLLAGALLALSAACCVACSGGSGSAHAAGWSVASLNGQCIWNAKGLPTLSGLQNGKGPFTLVAAITFNGNGGLVMNYNINLDGDYSQTAGVPGTYTVDPDGHGTLTYTSPASGSLRIFDFFITPHGKEIETIYHGDGTDSVSDRVAWGVCHFPS